MNPKRRVDEAIKRFRIADLPEDPTVFWKQILDYTERRRKDGRITRNAIAAYLRHVYSNYDHIIGITGFTQDEIDVIKAVASDKVMQRYDQWRKSKPYVR